MKGCSACGRSATWPGRQWFPRWRVAALAVVTGGWLIRRAGWPERVLCAPAAALLLYLHPTTIVIGAALFAVAIVLNLVLRRKSDSEPAPEPAAAG